jgi:hypothetical protein
MRGPKSTDRKRSPLVEPGPERLAERTMRRVRVDRSTSPHISASASLMRRPQAMRTSASGRYHPTQASRYLGISSRRR